MVPILVLAVLPFVLGSSLKSKVCPDGTYCLDTDTCCPLSSDAYGCCKMPNAVCCEDRKSCCPQNYKCGDGFCLPSDSHNKTTNTGITEPKEIHCFGSEYICPDDSTCCEGQEQGSYACCPMKNAVCCKDHQHCCPAGMTCDLETQKCLGSTHNSLMYSYNKTQGPAHTQPFGKFASLERSRNDSNNVCPGSEYICPGDYTCCRLPSGNWGCCRFPNAVCCADHEHCCPDGTQCDSTSQSCQKKGVSFASALKIPAKPLVKKQLVNKVVGQAQTQPFGKFVALERPRNDSNNVCPGSESQCPDDYTCCKLASGDWGCCPFPNAICCPDQEHCCPSGMKCDSTSQSCQKKGVSFASAVKIHAEPLVKNIICPDKSSCPSSSTCCVLNNKKFGCCLYPNAVCCNDGSHCCPNGFVCDVVEKQCLPMEKAFSFGKYSIDMILKLRAVFG